MIHEDGEHAKHTLRSEETNDLREADKLLKLKTKVEVKETLKRFSSKKTKEFPKEDANAKR